MSQNRAGHIVGTQWVFVKEQTPWMEECLRFYSKVLGCCFVTSDVLGESISGWQTFSRKGQMEVFSALWVILSLLHLLNSAMVAQMEPETIHKWMSMAMFRTWTLGHSLLTLLYPHFWKPHQVRILQSASELALPTLGTKPSALKDRDLEGGVSFY